MFDVAIIGAGTAGSFAALELSKLGHSVCVLEQNPCPGHKASCTGIISRDCLSLLRADRELIQHEAQSAKIFAPSGKCIRVERDTTQAYILDRRMLDQWLARQAQERGAQYLFSTPVDSIREQNAGVTIEIVKPGNPNPIQARCAVIACGVGGKLTAAAGLGRIREYAHGAQALVECAGFNEVEVYSGRHIAPGFFAWLVPAWEGTAKAGLLCSGNASKHIHDHLGRLKRQGKIGSLITEVSFGSIPLKTLPRTYSNRMLVVGDAAGQAKPTSGGGIYFGALCSRLAVETLDTCIRADDFSPGRMAAYQRRWHKLLKNELAIDYWAHRFYQSLTDKQAEHIFEIINKHGIHETLLASPDISFDWHSKVILDAIKHRSLQRSLEKLRAKPGFST